MTVSPTSRIGSSRLYFDDVTSTNDIARQQAEDHAPEGLAIIAAAQSRGRGRRGRTWASEKGKGLYLSLILRPSWPASDVGWLSTLGGVAVAEALENAGLREVRLKWPNDVLVHGRKIAGILIEPRIGGAQIEFAVVGMGINVRQTTEDWAGDLVGKATSCLMEGVDLTCERMADLALESLERMYRVAAAEGFGMLLAEWTARGGTETIPDID